MSVVRIDAVPSVPNPVEGTDYNVLAGNPSDGDPVRIDGRQFTYFSVNPASGPAAPRVLSKTEFNKYGWTQLGMGAFQKVLEDTRKSAGQTTADYEARAAVEQYDSALTLQKAEVQAIGAKIQTAGFMTLGQYNAIVDNWPAA